MLDTNPIWSPDGTQIAWSAKDVFNRENWRVWVMGSSGGDPRVLVAGLPGEAESGVRVAAWRGNRLLLAGWNGTWNAFTASLTGGDVTPVTDDAGDTIPSDWFR
jgi:hypothetical protein